MTGPVPSAAGAGEASTVHPATQSGRPRSPAVDHALIQATLAILEEDGYARLSMAGVAKRAGVSATTLYRRWASKEDLVGASLASLHSSAGCPDTGSLVGDLDAILRHLIVSLRGEPGRVLRGIIGAIFNSAELAALAQDRLGSPKGAIITEVLVRAVRRGEIAPLDAGLARNLIIGPVFHRFLMDGQVPSPDVVPSLLPMIVAALKAGPAQPS